MLAHLLQSNGPLPCKFELNRSNTANLRTVFLQPCRKLQKTRLFDVSWLKTWFFCAEVAFFNTGRPSTIKWAAIL